MKHGLLILFVLFLVSCSGGRQNRIDEIREKEKILMQSYEDVPDKSTAESLRQDYLGFAKDYPEDSLSPGFMHKAAELAVSISMYEEAISTLNDLENKYPNYSFLPDAMYFKGFILENHLKNLPEAKKVYEDFLKKYPDHKLASQVSAVLNNLGKSPEEMINEFMAKTQHADSLAIDSLK